MAGSKSRKFKIIENGLQTNKNRMLDVGEKQEFVIESEKILENKRIKNYPKRSSVVFLRLGVSERKKEKSVAIDLREIENRVTYVANETTVTDVREAINNRNDYEDAKAIAEAYWEEMEKFNNPLKAKKYAMETDFLQSEFLLVSDISSEAIKPIRK